MLPNCYQLQFQDAVAVRGKMDQLLTPISAKIERAVSSVVNQYTDAEQLVIERYLAATVHALNKLSAELEQEGSKKKSQR